MALLAATIAAVGVLAAPLAASAAEFPLGDPQGSVAPPSPDGGSLLRADGEIQVGRIQGADRYEVAANLARSLFTPGIPVIYVANGQNYPDALSAGPAAAVDEGALVLTTPTVLPTESASVIGQLKPKKIVVVGGPASVSEAVFSELAAIQPNIVRLGGADRYAVSRAVVDYAFPRGVGTVFVATGGNFPDALSAGPASSHYGGGVLLVNGAAAGLDQPTLALLDDKGVERAYIAGGPNSVSAGVETALRAAVPNVARYSGADRYAVAATINESTWTGAVQGVLVASGQVFPDALSAGPVAGALDVPLFLVAKDCYPRPAADGIFDSHLQPQGMVLIGGVNTLSNALVDTPQIC